LPEQTAARDKLLVISSHDESAEQGIFEIPQIPRELNWNARAEADAIALSTKGFPSSNKSLMSKPFTAKKFTRRNAK
jgi:hypothetical protein